MTQRISLRTSIGGSMSELLRHPKNESGFSAYLLAIVVLIEIRERLEIWVAKQFRLQQADAQDVVSSIVERAAKAHGHIPVELRYRLERFSPCHLAQLPREDRLTGIRMAFKICRTAAIDLEECRGANSTPTWIRKF